MASKETSRSLERGLQVLESLSRLGSSTLSQVSRDIDLPVTTTRRLLTTLVDRNFVRRSRADGRYRTNITVPALGTASLSKTSRLFVDHAMTAMIGITERIKWPCDLHVMDHTVMRFVETTRPISPHYVVPGVIDRRFNIFGSATGQACLANSPPEMIEHLLDLTKDDPLFGPSRLNMSRSRIFEEIEKTRKRGYGKRLFPFLGETVISDNLGAIAIALKSPTETLFSIALVFPNSLMSADHFASLHLEDLQSAADSVVEHMMS